MKKIKSIFNSRIYKAVLASFIVLANFLVFLPNTALAVVDYSQYDYSLNPTGAGSSTDFSNSNYNTYVVNFTAPVDLTFDVFRICLSSTGLNGDVALKVYELSSSHGSLSSATLLSTAVYNFPTPSYGTGSTCGTAYPAEFDFPASINFIDSHFYAFAFEKGTATTGGIVFYQNDLELFAENSFYNSSGNHFSSWNTGVPFSLGTSLSTTNRISVSNPTSDYIYPTVTASINGTYYSDSNTVFTHGSLTGVHLYMKRIDGYGSSSDINVNIPYTQQDSLVNWSYNVDLPENTTWEVTASLTYGTTDLYSSSPIPFSLVTNPNPTASSVATCNSLDVGCYIKQAFVWLFYPTFSFNAFMDVWNSIQDRFPFNYLSYIKSVWTDLESGTGSVSTLSIPIGNNSLTLFSASMLSSNPIAPMIRSFLSIVIWLFVPFSIYKKVVTLFFRSSDVK